MSPKTIKILYFASLAETLGCHEDNITLPENIQTGHDLADFLMAQGSHYYAAFHQRENIHMACDHQLCTSLDTPLGKAKEIAFFPPMTGG